MPDTPFSSLHEDTARTPDFTAAAAAQPPCGDCLGSGGWFRYEPALEPAPGLRYLSCVQCRGSGLTALLRA